VAGCKNIFLGMLVDVKIMSYKEGEEFQNGLPAFLIKSIDYQKQTAAVFDPSTQDIMDVLQNQRIGPWTLMAIIQKKGVSLAVFENLENRKGPIVYMTEKGIFLTLAKSLELTSVPEKSLYRDRTLEDTDFGGICIMAEEHPWSFWHDPRVTEFIPEAELDGDPDKNWPIFKDIVFKNITIQHSQAFNSRYFPDPDIHGLSGWGGKLHIPTPEFESGHREPKQSHYFDGIIFDHVKILDYFDGGTFTRYGFGSDHKAGELIPEHYLSNLTTNNWIVWEGANRTDSHSPEPSLEEKMERIKFWEKQVKFITPGK